MTRTPETVAKELSEAKISYMYNQQTNVAGANGAIDELKLARLSLANEKNLNSIRNLTAELRELVKAEANNA